MRLGRNILVFLSALPTVLCVSAQESGGRVDTLRQTIDEITVRGVRSHALIQMKGQGDMQWNISLMDDLPKVLGNADPMHYTQTLPGVQTNNEYDGGLHILGCDNTHNLVSIDGVPIYNVNHLLGIFSVFNPTHFKQMSIRKTATRADFPNRLGGVATMGSWHTQADSISGDVSVGLISSQGTLRLPINSKNTITASCRGCYLNQLYGYALKVDESQLGYTFGDANVSWLYTPDCTNTLWMEAYWGGDQATIRENSFQTDAQLRWGNTMVALHWNREFPRSGNKMNHTLYYTSSNSRFSMDQQMVLKMPAGIRDFGYKSNYQNRWGNVGTDIVLHSILPSIVSVNNPSDGGVIVEGVTNDTDRKRAKEMSFYADGNILQSSTLLAVLGLRLTAFFDDANKNYYAVDPSLTIRYVNRNWEAALTTSFRHQYVCQVGFSSLGLPTESWMTVDSQYRPMASFSLLAGMGYRFFDDAMCLHIEIYGKQLRHLTEFDGTLLDLLYTNSETSALTLQGKGRIYGANISVEKTNGRLTGWICYNIGCSQRQFTGVHRNLWYAANHDRTHELNIVACWKTSKHWSFGGTFVAASGTPFTMPEHLYLYGGRLLAQYSSHNAYRLTPYSRLDLSANYKFLSRSNKEHGINISIYNVLGRKNELFYSWHIFSDGSFCFRPMSFLLKTMPSISYYAKF